MDTNVKEPKAPETADLNNPAPTTAPATPVTGSKLNAPKTSTFVAHLMSIDEAQNGDTVLNVVEPDSTIKQLWVSKNYWAILGKRLREGDYINVKVENRVEGKTEYMDADGVVTKHTKSGESFLSATRISKNLFDAAMPANMQDIDLISAAPTDGVANALATYLGRIRSAQLGSVA